MFSKLSIMMISILILSFCIKSPQANSYKNHGDDQINLNQTETCNIDPDFCVASDPISIDGNGDLMAQAKVNGWDEGGTRDGSWNNPYLISGYSFITSSTPAIDIKNTDLYLTIYNNYINGLNWSDMGILLDGVNNVRIILNTITGLGGPSSWGIYLYESQYNRIVLNHIWNDPNQESDFNGIFLEYSSFNTIVANEIHKGLVGVGLDNNSYKNNVRENVIYNFSYTGIESTNEGDYNHFSDNEISNCTRAIYVSDVEFNRINNNKLLDNDWGIEFTNSIGLNFGINNTILHSNFNGIVINNANNTQLVSNTIENTVGGFAVEIKSGEGISMTWNNLINNTHYNSQVNDNGTLSYINNNYFNEWTTPDGEFDNFVDNPYSIAGNANNFDYLPLTKANYFTDFQVIYPFFGEIVSREIQIEWIAAADTYDHDFNYSIFYSSDGGTNWNLIASSVEGTKYLWDTTSVEDGYTYVIMVVAGGNHGIGFSRYSTRNFSVNNADAANQEIDIWIDLYDGRSIVGDTVSFGAEVRSTYLHDMENIKFIVEVRDPNSYKNIISEVIFDLQSLSTVYITFDVDFYMSGYFDITVVVTDDLGISWVYQFNWEAIEEITITEESPTVTTKSSSASTSSGSVELLYSNISLILLSLSLTVIIYRRKK